MYHAVSGCIRLYQTLPDYTRLYQAATGCTRPLKRSEHNIHLGEVRMIQQFKPVPEHHQHEQEHHHPAHLSAQGVILRVILPVLFLSETIINPNAAVSITIVARSRAHCRNLRSAVIIAPFFKSVGGLPIGGYWQTVYMF